jgi:hypothetical protein
MGRASAFRQGEADQAMACSAHSPEMYLLAKDFRLV